jgi:uncharacterized protein YecE (DUF72 family)
MSQFSGRALLGTCGWSYDDWAPGMYAPQIATRERLRVYGERFSTVEIDSTFYGIPSLSTVQGWVERTPEGFVFSAKFPRAVTHEGRLSNSGEVAQAFVETMSELGEKLGALLLQFPPSFSAAQMDDLERFLEGLPDGYVYAVEIRHPSWLTEEFAALLKRWQVSLVLTASPRFRPFWRVTSQVAYIRWLGRWNAYESYDRLRRSVDTDLDWWIPRIEHYLARGGTVLGYVNNNFAGHAPAVVELLEERISSEDRAP